MFATIDRYVARSYLFSLGVCYGALVGLYLVIDISGNITTLYEHSGFWGLGPVVVRLYVSRIPLILHALAPFVPLLAAMFTVSKMRRDNELLCLTASGVSVFRVLRPLFAVTVCFGLLYVANRELVIPRLLDELVEGDTILASRNPDVVFRFQRRDGLGNDFFIREYRVFARKMLVVNITTYYPPEEAGGHHTPAQRIIASEGRWRRDTDGRERWLLSHGRVVFYQPDRTPADRPVLRFGEDGFRIRGADEKPQGETEIVSDLHPRQIRRHSQEMEYYSTAQLAELIRQSPGQHGLKTSYHRRFASPAAVIVLLMLGLPFALRGYGRSVFRSIGIGMFLCFVYYAADVFCLFLGVGGSLPPAAAAWLPVLIFGPLGFYLLDTVPT